MKTLIPLVLALSVTGCGGGGYGSGSGYTTEPNQSVGGIWTTQYTEAQGPNAGHTIVGKAIVTEAGESFFAGIDQTTDCAELGFGTLMVTGSDVAGVTANAVATFATTQNVNTTCTYSDGSTFGTGTVTGTVAQRSSLTLTANAITSMGTTLPTETHTWTFSDLYNTASSLATIAGTYTDGANTMTISSAGAVFEQDAASGCVINGSVSVINTSYNAYNISFTFSNCAGNDAILNGVTATGLAYVDATSSPTQVVIALKLTVSGVTAVVAGEIAKN